LADFTTTPWETSWRTCRGPVQPIIYKTRGTYPLYALPSPPCTNLSSPLTIVFPLLHFPHYPSSSSSAPAHAICHHPSTRSAVNCWSWNPALPSQSTKSCDQAFPHHAHLAQTLEGWSQCPSSTVMIITPAGRQLPSFSPTPLLPLPFIKPRPASLPPS